MMFHSVSVHDHSHHYNAILLVLLLMLLTSTTLAANGVVRNDVCMDAIPIVVGSSNIVVNVSGATIDTNEVTTDCLGNEPQYRGVWYQFTSTANRLFLQFCATIYSSISIYEGTCDSSLLQCVAATMTPCAHYRFIFNTEIGTTYYILAQSYYDDDPLSLSLYEFPSIPNDYCTDAIPITIGTTIAVNTTYATADITNFIDRCETSMDHPGVWYTFTGTGTRLVATLCAEVYTSISIYQGSCTSSTLECIAVSNSPCDRESLSFDTEIGIIYYVLVQSHYEVVLDLSIFELPPVNDHCIDAIPITINSTVVVNTTYATIDTSEISGSCIDNSKVGVWYNMIGTGQRIMAELCSYWYTSISIFYGRCGSSSSLQCMAYTDNPCDPDQIFYFDTLVNNTYYILVRSYYDVLLNLTIVVMNSNETNNISSLPPTISPSIVPTVHPTISNPPTISPTVNTSPPTSCDEISSCGLFGYSIFCPFTFRGIIGRLIRQLLGYNPC